MDPLQLEANYQEILHHLQNTDLPFGVEINDGPHLRGFVAFAGQLARIELQADCYKGPPRAAYAISVMILGSLASPWTFNVKREADSLFTALPDFPTGYGPEEASLWNRITGVRRLTNLKDLLACRIGNCVSYSLTLAVCLKSALPDQRVWVGWRHGHIWVETNIYAIPDEMYDLTQIDLAEWSHGHTRGLQIPTYRIELTLDGSSKIEAA